MSLKKYYYFLCYNLSGDSMEKIMVSACLLGENCKYNGKNNKNEKVLEYIKDKEVIPVCPESFGGLSTPRIPSEIKDNIVINKEGIDVTKNFIEGANKVLEIAKKYNVKKAILKQKSPSCGSGKIYDGTFSGNIIIGDGITTRLLKENNIEVITEEDL